MGNRDNRVIYWSESAGSQKGRLEKGKKGVIKKPIWCAKKRNTAQRTSGKIEARFAIEEIAQEHCGAQPVEGIVPLSRHI